MIDDAAEWIKDWLTRQTAGEGWWRSLLILAAALIAYRLLAFVLRRLVPALLRGLITVLHGALAGLAGLGLIVEGLCSLLFRAAHLRPPRFLYRLGDVLAAGRQWLRNRAPRLKWHTRALSRIPAAAVLVVAAVLVWQGHAFICDRDADAELCRQPAPTVGRTIVETAREAAQQIHDVVAGRP